MPIKAETRRTPLDFDRPQQRRKRQGDTVQDTFLLFGSARAGLPFGRLVRFPGLVLRRHRRDLGGTEYVRVAAQHLVRDRRGDVGESKQPGFLGHASMEDDLEQKVTEFVLQRRRVAARDRVGDLVGFFDCVRCDRGEILCAIPWTTALRVAQLGHDREEAVERGTHRRFNPN